MLCIGMSVAAHADTNESLPMEDLKVFSEIFGKHAFIILGFKPLASHSWALEKLEKVNINF